MTKSTPASTRSAATRRRQQPVQTKGRQRKANRGASNVDVELESSETVADKAPPKGPAGRQAEAAGIRETLARALHVIRGTRSLLAVGILTLILSMIEPALPADATHLPWTLPTFLLLVAGISSVAREGVGARQRTLSLLTDDHAAGKLWRHSWWALSLCALLLPRLFLGAYGIPHMSPLTGLILPTMQRRIALAFLAIVVIVPIMALRRTKRYDPTVVIQRPRDLRTHPDLGAMRDVLLLSTLLIIIVWLILLRQFWQPFSLLAWPPGLESLQSGIRGVAAVTFALIIPVTLFLSIQAHAALIRASWSAPATTARNRTLGFAILHVFLNLVAVTLHAYDVLWIVRYQAATGI